MPEHVYQRRLSVVLYADVCGFGRLMARDEVATVSLLAEYRALIDSAVIGNGGRTVDMTGDSILAEFSSAVKAVTCAVAFQHALSVLNAALDPSRRMDFRVGLNLGDILVDPNAIFGDGVNVAARIQGLARPGGVCLSGVLHKAVQSRLSFEYEFLGKRSLKNIIEPVAVYRVRMAHEPSGKPASMLVTPRGESRVPVAFAPFENLSGSEQVQYLIDGLVEDLATSLSKFRNITLVAGNDTSLAGLEPDRWREANNEFGINYLLGGSVRRAGDRVRLQLRLIDARSGQVAWGDRYDREIDDLILSNDDIVQAVVSTLLAHIEQIEYRYAVRATTQPRGAFHCLLLGQQHARGFTRESNLMARRMYQEAIRVNSGYARAYAALSRTYNLEWRYSWSESPEHSLDTALEYARMAVDFDDLDPCGHSELGLVHLFMREHELAIADYERAMTLNPNDTEVMADMADAMSYDGRGKEAIGLLEASLRLNPIDPDWRLWSLGDAYYVTRDYRSVIRTMNQMHNPDESHRLLAASYAQLGLREQAAAHAREVLRRQPDFSATRWAGIQPDSDPDDTEHYLEGLRKAGL